MIGSSNGTMTVLSRRKTVTVMFLVQDSDLQDQEHDSCWADLARPSIITCEAAQNLLGCQNSNTAVRVSLLH